MAANMIAIAHCEAALKENHLWRSLPVPMNSAKLWPFIRDPEWRPGQAVTVSAPYASAVPDVLGEN
jgi:hypothetical protein